MKAEVRRQKIIDAAVKSFSKQGYEKTSIALICDEADIARGTLYQYFGDKKSLFQTILEEYIERVHESIGPLDFRDFESPRHLLFEHNLRLIREISENRHIVKILLREATAENPETFYLVEKMRHILTGVIRDELIQGAKLDLFEIEDPELAAIIFLGGILEMAERYIFHAKMKFDPQELAEKVTNLQANAIGLAP
jgi:TetR/AcrR family transcriptional regulator, fatty acid metabolism regulator protein